MSSLSENFVRHVTKPDRVSITATNLNLTDFMFAPDRDLIIRADFVTLNEDILLPGRLVHIFARQVNCTKDITIDVSGKKGDPDYKEGSRVDGQGAGAPGNTGDNGGNGSNGGKIEIYADNLTGKLNLVANGGKGGRAQDGGWGMKGTTGPHGRKNVRAALGSSEKPNNGEDGGTGGAGGRAGDAGIPGKGGNGGQIEVAIAAGIYDGQITAEAAPGEPGELGKKGEPGEGGNPGDPGTWWPGEQIRDPGDPGVRF